MKPWVFLYAMIWIAFVEFLLAMTPVARQPLLYAHVALGLGIVALAAYNHASVRATRVPGRVKRTTQSTLQLSVAIALLGLLLVLRVGAGWTLFAGVTAYGVLVFVHAVIAFAILTQAAAVAIAFDMWEEKEFAHETEPGEIPAMEMTTKAMREAKRPPRAT